MYINQRAFALRSSDKICSQIEDTPTSKLNRPTRDFFLKQSVARSSVANRSNLAPTGCLKFRTGTLTSLLFNIDQQVFAVRSSHKVFLNVPQIKDTSACDSSLRQSLVPRLRSSRAHPNWHFEISHQQLHFFSSSTLANEHSRKNLATKFVPMSYKSRIGRQANQIHQIATPSSVGCSLLCCDCPKILPR